MSATKYLLVGGGLASVEAIKQIRELDASGQVTLVSDEAHLPYDRPPLSKEFLRGDRQRQNLFLVNDEFYQQKKVDTLLGVRAESLDLRARAVALSSGDRMTFEKLLIATGGSPVRLPLPGTDLEGVHYLRTLDNSEAIAREAAPGKRAVVIGAGFIGIEVAASLTQRGVQATVIEALPQIWPRFADETLAAYFQKYCERKGVVFFTGDTVERIEGKGRPSAVVTKGGRRVPCDFVCIAVGIRPNVGLAEAAGLKVDNGIVVDEGMRTSHPDVFAAGDVANYPDPIFQRRRRVEHFGQAEYMGQVAGRAMAGGQARYDLLTYVWSDIFDLHLEFAGDESERDQTVLRGRLEGNSFTALFLEQGRLRAYFAVNTSSSEFPVFQRFIRRNTDLSGRIGQLQDTTVNLRELL